MSEEFSGTVDIQTASLPHEVSISLDGNSGKITLKSPSPIQLPGPEFKPIRLDGASGNIDLGVVRQDSRGYTIHLDGQSGNVRLGLPYDEMSVGQPPEIDTIRLDGASGNITLGEAGHAGELVVRNEEGQAVLHLEGKGALLRVGGNGPHGVISVRDGTLKETIRMDGKVGNIVLGGNGADGDMEVRNTKGDLTIHLDGDVGNIVLGGNGADGDVIVRNKDGKDTISLDGDAGDILVRNKDGKNTIHLGGDAGDIILGGNGADGDVVVRTKDGKETIRLDGYVGNIVLGGNGADGDVIVRTKDGKDTIYLNGDAGHIIAGGNGADGDVIVRTKDGKETIRLDGDAGDIILRNADFAEDFDVLESEQIEPGTVMVLDQEGKLQQSTAAYDKKVAGVVSGAGECKPGIVLDKQPEQANRRSVALVGKVYCKVDAGYSSIEVGDLLTTSPTPGHAMKVSDPLQAFGAVLGKALRPHQSGIGLIPILVALQ